MTSNDEAFDPLLRPEQVCEILGVTNWTLQTWRARGVGPESVRLGYRTVRYRQSAVQAFLATRTAG